MDNNHMKTYSTLSGIMEMQSSPQMRPFLIHIHDKKREVWQSQVVEKMQISEIPLPVRVYTGTAILENIWALPWKAEIHISDGLAIPLLGI